MVIKSHYFHLLEEPLNQTESSESPWSSQNQNSIRFKNFWRFNLISISVSISQVRIGLNRIGYLSKLLSIRKFIFSVESRVSFSLFQSGEMVRLFLTLSPAISRLNIYCGISILATYHHSLRLQKHNKLKTKTPDFSLISPSASSNYQRTGFYSTGTRISSLPKSEISKFDDNLVVLGIETSCDDTAAAVVSSHLIIFCLFFSLSFTCVNLLVHQHFLILEFVGFR